VPNIAMLHETDPKESIIAEIGDLSGFEIAHNEVLVAIYLRPEKTKGGIVLTASNLKEDLYQSKVGLVLAIGPGCVFKNVQIRRHDWVVVRPSDAYALDVNFVPCRLVYDDQIRGRVKSPGMIW
jgi:co-chaperonin GroES (HSP10)